MHNIDATSALRRGLSDIACRVLQKRYLARDENGTVIESVEDMFHRVAKTIASAEKNDRSHKGAAFWELAFYKVMTNLEFLPNSPTLLNAGKGRGQLSSCFVIPFEDSLDSIFNTIKHVALIQKNGGGTGFCLSKLRPMKDDVRGESGVAGGPVAVMDILSRTIAYIRQGGVRNGCRELQPLSIGNNGIELVRLRFLNRAFE